MSSDTPHPPIVAQEQWLTARKELLGHEKELTRHYDRVAAERRRLPMVKVEKRYVFTGSAGELDLAALFDGRRQLIVYHFMFDPAWERGCSGCTGLVDAIGDVSMLAQRDTTFVLVSRAPFAKLAAYRDERGWTLPWYSSYGSDFNYDYHATLDSNVAPVEHNFKTQAELAARGAAPAGEAQAVSVFFRLGDDIFHTYTAFARGTEFITDAYSLLDLTPYGRQEDFEDSPSGFPQKPTYG